MKNENVDELNKTIQSLEKVIEGLQVDGVKIGESQSLDKLSDALDKLKKLKEKVDSSIKISNKL